MPASSGNSHFATTQWSLVLHAGQPARGESRAALATLCERYWLPLYAYARRRLGDATQAQDLTQEFFARVLEKGTLEAASPERGRFRSFMLVAMKNFLASQWQKDQAIKRGGGCRELSLDFESGESKLRLEPWHELTPERLFDRQWTLQLLEVVMQRLQRESVAAGKSRQFEVLKLLLAGPHDGVDYATASVELELSQEATRQAASRLRKRYRELLREEVSQTVAGDEEIDDELRGLLASLG